MTTQRRKRGELDKLLDLVQKTKGFTVRRSKQGTAIVTSSERKGFQTFKLTGTEATTLRNGEAQLSRLGWSKEVYQDQQAIKAAAEAAGEPIPDDEEDDGLPVPELSLEDQYRQAADRIERDPVIWEKQVIGPAEAREYLDLHRTAAEERGRIAGLSNDPLPLDAPPETIRQRKLLKSHVQRLVREIRAGMWKLSPQGIAIGVDGWIADGQHRFEAIVESGCAEAFWLAFNVPDDVFPHFDRGRPRSDTDILYTQGKNSDPALPPALKLLYMYDNINDITQWTTAGKIPSGAELLDYGAKHYGSIGESMKFCAIFRGREALTPASAAALRFLVLREDENADIDAFLTAVKYGHGAEHDSAASALYRHGQNRFKAHRKAAGSTISRDLFLAGIWTWNKHVAGLSTKNVGYQLRFGIPDIKTS